MPSSDEDKSIAKQCQKMKANEMKRERERKKIGEREKVASKCIWRNENLIKNAVPSCAHGAHI